MIAITPFLATHEHVQQALLHSDDFKGFVGLAMKSCGEVPKQFELELARFRVVDPRQGQRDDLTLDDMVSAWGQQVSIRNLIVTCCTVDRTRLIHSLWRLETFEEVKFWLKGMAAITRFGRDAEGVLRGQLLLPAREKPPQSLTMKTDCWWLMAVRIQINTSGCSSMWGRRHEDKRGPHRGLEQQLATIATFCRHNYA